MTTVFTRLPQPQHVLVPGGIDVRSAVPDGSWDAYTDFHRWNSPALHPAVQYCVADHDVARARALEVVYQSGATLNDLNESQLPGLLDVHIEPAQAVDLTVPRMRREVGLPGDYPNGAADPEVRAQCRNAGDTLLAEGQAAIAVPTAMPQVLTHNECLARLPAAALRVTGRRTWKQWYGGA